MYNQLAGWTDIVNSIARAIPSVIGSRGGSGDYSPGVYNPATGAISYPPPAATYRDPRIVGYDANGRPLYAAEPEEAGGGYLLPLAIGGAALFFLMRRRR